MKFIVLILNFFSEMQKLWSHTLLLMLLFILGLVQGIEANGQHRRDKNLSTYWLEHLKCPVKIWCSVLIEVNINFKTRSHLIVKKILQIFWTKIWEINYISRMLKFKDLMWWCGELNYNHHVQHIMQLNTEGSTRQCKIQPFYSVGNSHIHWVCTRQWKIRPSYSVAKAHIHWVCTRLRKIQPSYSVTNAHIHWRGHTKIQQPAILFSR